MEDNDMAVFVERPEVHVCKRRACTSCDDVDCNRFWGQRRRNMNDGCISQGLSGWCTRTGILRIDLTLWILICSQAKEDSKLTMAEFVEKYREDALKMGARKFTGAALKTFQIEEVRLMALHRLLAWTFILPSLCIQGMADLNHHCGVLFCPVLHFRADFIAIAVPCFVSLCAEGIFSCLFWCSAACNSLLQMLTVDRLEILHNVSWIEAANPLSILLMMCFEIRLQN